MKISTVALACFFVPFFVVRSPAQDAAALRKPANPAHREASPTEKNTASLADVLADYGKLIGKEIIVDNTVNPTSVLTLSDLDGIAPPQRTNLMGRSLFLNGYTLVDADKDTVVVLGPGKNPRSVGVPLYTKPDELPDGERVFSYLFKLEHRDPIELAGILQQFVPPSNDVNFTAVEKAHAVIATAPTSIMRVLLKLVAALDTADKTAE